MQLLHPPRSRACQPRSLSFRALSLRVRVLHAAFAEPPCNALRVRVLSATFVELPTFTLRVREVMTAFAENKLTETVANFLKMGLDLISTIFDILSSGKEICEEIFESKHLGNDF